MFKSIGTLFRKMKESEDWREVQRESEERRRAQAEAGDVLDLDAIGEPDMECRDDDLSLEEVQDILSELDEEK